MDINDLISQSLQNYDKELNDRQRLKAEEKRREAEQREHKEQARAEAILKHLQEILENPRVMPTASQMLQLLFGREDTERIVGYLVVINMSMFHMIDSRPVDGRIVWYTAKSPLDIRLVTLVPITEKDNIAEVLLSMESIRQGALIEGSLPSGLVYQERHGKFFFETKEEAMESVRRAFEKKFAKFKV